MLRITTTVNRIPLSLPRSMSVDKLGLGSLPLSVNEPIHVSICHSRQFPNGIEILTGTGFVIPKIIPWTSLCNLLHPFMAPTQFTHKYRATHQWADDRNSLSNSHLAGPLQSHAGFNFLQNTTGKIHITPSTANITYWL